MHHGVIEFAALFLAGLLAGEEFVVRYGVRGPLAALETDPAASDFYYGLADPMGVTYQRSGMNVCTIIRHGGPTAGSSHPHRPGQPLPGAINLSCMDGHAELVQLPRLWSFYWHLNWKPSRVNQSP